NDANGNPIQTVFTDTGMVSASSGKRLGGRTVTSGTKTKNTSEVFVWQGYLLPNSRGEARILPNFGWRKDIAKTAAPDAASIALDQSGLLPVMWDVSFTDYSAATSGINQNLGLVVRPFHWISFSYVHSATYAIPNGKYDPFGNLYSGAHGKGYDAGIRFD